MMLELRDRLAAMRRQELHYRCCDYTKPRQHGLESPKPGLPPNCSSQSLVSLLDECASLVTDPLTRIASSPQLADAPKRKMTDPAPKSPSSVAHMRAHQFSDPAADLSDNASATSFSEDSAVLAETPLEEEDERAAIFHDNPDLGEWRLQMFDWACMVVDGFRMDRCAVLATAFNILDRYTICEIKRADSPPITREDYQLFAMTALYVAVKVLEPFPRKMGLETLTVMSRDFYSAQDIVSTEQEMLVSLKWRTTPPTAIGFCRELVQFLFPNECDRGVDMEQVFSTICDVSVSDPSFLNYSHAIIAIAALLHAARLTGRSQRERNGVKKQAIGILGLEERHAASLDDVYKKMELLYC